MIRLATENDIAVIHQLAVTTWKSHYPGIITMDQIEYMLDLMYSETTLKKQMSEGQRFWLTENEGVTVGYLSESTTSPGNYFLHKFYLLPGVQGKGAGKRFFHDVFNQKNDLKTIQLNVNRKNYKSINFYIKLGFMIEGLKDEPIGNGYEVNDFVMVKKTEY